MSTTPYEIIAGPAQMWIADVGTTFPAVNATPNGSWTALGETEGGVKAKHGQSVEMLRVDQRSGPVKAIRSEETLEVSTSLANLTLENFAIALSQDVTTAVTPSRKTIGLSQGLDVKVMALLVRGPSPYGDFNLQYEVPICVQTEEPEVEFVRDDKSVLAVKFDAIEDPDAATDGERFGRLVAQTA